uniref:Uncharacterized protein n=1 Tax=Rhizophora mucronata TaxID=61149 RepID=A0A2P2QPV8_RHIMU
MRRPIALERKIFFCLRLDQSAFSRRLSLSVS